MCVIVDNDVAHRVLLRDDDPDFGPVHRAVFPGNSAYAMLVYGGRLTTELSENRSVLRVLVELDRAGRTTKVDDKEYELEHAFVCNSNLCVSNDTHIIALARAAKTRLLCTLDSALQEDFDNKLLIDAPRGKVYTRAAHAHLLRKLCR